MRSILKFVFWILALAPCGNAHAQTKVGDWNVSVGNDCRIWDEWRNDDGSTSMLGIGYIDRGKSLTMVFGDSTWKLVKNEDFQIVLRVDESWKDTVPGSAIGKDKAAAFLLPVSSAAITALTSGHELLMDIQGKGDDYSYAYTLDADTAKALGALDACRFDVAPLDQEGAKGSTEPTGEPRLHGAAMSMSNDGGSTQTVFPKNAPKLYFRGDISGAKTDDVARVDWIAEKTKAAEPNFRIDSVTMTLAGPEGTIRSSLNIPNAGWPVGRYRVDVFVNNARTGSVSFRIE